MIDVSGFDVASGLVDHCLINDWSWDQVEQFKNTQIQKNLRYYRDLGNGGYTVGGADSIPAVRSILDFLQPLRPEFHARAGLYVSTQSNSASFPLHVDPGQHVWIWQVIGSTPWQVGNQCLTLKQDQLLYIQPGVPHCARPDSPRVSVSLSLEEFD